MRVVRGTAALTAIFYAACTQGQATAPAVAHSVDGVFASDGARLAYTLRFPGGPPPYPAVVVVHGSGEITRSVQAYFTNQLVAKGLAVLSYDKRGTGQSEGVYEGVSVRSSERVLTQLARDAARGADVLFSRREIDHTRIGF